jgi:hypothetical protein
MNPGNYNFTIIAPARALCPETNQRKETDHKKSPRPHQIAIPNSQIPAKDEKRKAEEAHKAQQLCN